MTDITNTQTLTAEPAMTLADFDFDLPEDRIALRPATPRTSARLMHVRAGGDVLDHTVADLPDLLRSGDLLITNNSRVVPAALRAVRPARDATGHDVDVHMNLIARLGPLRWQALAKPARRLAVGDRLQIADDLTAQVTAKAETGILTLDFHCPNNDLDAALEAAGDMPLPPYIAAKRPADEQDRQDYQTMFAQDAGSVAAPTAGLHFTPQLMQALRDKGITHHQVTLHVGAGTFLPVKVDNIHEHKMHCEWGEVSPQVAHAIQTAKAEGRRVVVVGTTALRILESAAHATGQIAPFAAETDIFITPGFDFKVADVLMTNFHLPKSTLFMLVCAFAGTATMQAAYAHAIDSGYRFFSYGDANLLERPS